MADTRDVHEDDDFGDFVVNQSDNELNQAVVGGDDFSNFKEFDVADVAPVPTGESMVESAMNYDILNDLKPDFLVQKISEKNLQPENVADALSRQGGAKELIDLLSNYDRQAENSRLGHLNDDSYRDIGTQSFLESMSPLVPDSKFRERTMFSLNIAESFIPVHKEQKDDENLFDDFQEEPSAKENRESLIVNQEINLVDISAISRGNLHKKQPAGRELVGGESLLYIVDQDVSLQNVADITAPGPLDKDIEDRIMEESLVKPSSKVADDEEFGEEQEEARIEESSTSNILKEESVIGIYNEIGIQPQMNILLGDMNEPAQGESYPTPHHIERDLFDSPIITGKTTFTQSAEIFISETPVLDMKKASKDQPIAIDIDLNDIALIDQVQVKVPPQQVEATAPTQNDEDDLFDDFQEEQPGQQQDMSSPIIKDTGSAKKGVPSFSESTNLMSLDLIPSLPLETKANENAQVEDLFHPEAEYHGDAGDKQGPPHDPSHPIHVHPVLHSTDLLHETHPVDQNHAYHSHEHHSHGHQMLVPRHHDLEEHKPAASQEDLDEDLFGEEVSEPLPGGVDEQDDIMLGVDPNAPHHLPVVAGEEVAAVDIVMDAADIIIDPSEVSDSHPTGSHHEVNERSRHDLVKQEDLHQDSKKPAQIITAHSDAKVTNAPLAFQTGGAQDDEDLFDDFEEFTDEKTDAKAATEVQDDEISLSDLPISHVPEITQTEEPKVSAPEPVKVYENVEDDEEDLFGDEQEFEDAKQEQLVQQVPEPVSRLVAAPVINRPQLVFDANQFDVLREHLQGLSSKTISQAKHISKSKKHNGEQAKMSTCKVMSGQPTPVDEHYQALNRLLSECSVSGYQLTTEDKLNYSLHRKLMLTYWQSSIFNESEYLEAIDQPTAMLKDFTLGDINEINKRIVAEKWKRMSEDYLKSLPDYSSIFA